MKVVVLGGGIAGLCMGIYLHQHDIDVSVNERQIFSAVGGHAFLMHHDGITVLNELATESNCPLPGKPVHTFILRDADGLIVNEKILEDWQCFKRTDLLACLNQLLPASRLRNNRVFSHFVYEADQVVAAAFSNGEVEYGDVFIGADGANSIVRQQLFGEVKFEPGKVKEVVGIIQHAELAAALQGKFTKFQQKDQGLSFGLIPTSATEMVWFMQYDPLLADIPEGINPRDSDQYHELLHELCLNLLKDFPATVQQVLKCNDFRTSYIWNTRDFDLLPSFHHQNVVLIGDAAHVALPFTSAGTTNAMLDAKTLSHCLLHYPNLSTAFSAYYQLRAESIKEHVNLGRALRDSFLSADASDVIPLISSALK
ncbi:FAD-dependent oxidoreductase [Pedobacter cryoconitis]|uniref:2-polyprenyl-6-methoxyphenol hydroxylase-like FAD-dependent oxidoreductase n=1 Tax=Pedobacter cryoconitis TaxID=188932 RepID=A0A327T154_9SPHI|nr:NAD(P)/FAD-dependent oxidoreductase [Pedobacter cryoconitis]RAJ33443.1 2-polyprenyl-6-methoxyphenol hydroxylase-like FAD-dependent oxidoreductase [Pedobacter cryoconitis]